MNFIKRIFSKESTPSMFIQIIRYMISGGLALAVDFTSMVIMHEYFGINAVYAATFGFCVGLIITYIMSITWIFDKRKLANPLIEFAIFALIGLFGIGITYFGMDILIENIDLHYTILKIITSTTVAFFNFFAKKLLLFSK